MCVYIIKGGTNGQDVPEPLDTYVLSKFSSPKIIIIEHLAISFRPYELIFSIIYIHGVNTRNGSIYIMKYISWKWWFIYAYILKATFIIVIFIEHGLTISFIPVTIFISLETWGLYLIIREKSKSYFSHRILLSVL